MAAIEVARADRSMKCNSLASSFAAFSLPNFMNASSTALFAIGLAVACGRGAEPIRVSTFSTILTEIAEQVGGDRVVVTGHVKPGIDPHDFEPKPADLSTV